ncbi:MAG: cytochrome c [Chloroflexi bacterium]|nr:cytochrome c [Chloroflexota bacterium]
MTLLILVSAACSPGDPGSTVQGVFYRPEDIAQGQALYEQTCAACHGVDGQGQFPEAPLMPDSTGRYGAPPHNEGGHTWHHTDELLIRYVVEGGFADPKFFYEMPSFGALYDRQQAALIIAYIKTMWTPEQRIRQHHMTLEEEQLVAQTKE